MDLNSLLLDSRMVLKAMKDVLTPRKGEGNDEAKTEDGNAAVPAEPSDPDRLDTRAEGASPTEADLAAAKGEGDASGAGAEGSSAEGGESQGAGASGADAGAEGQGSEGPKGAEGSGAGEGGEGDPKFDEFGHRDMDARDLRKAFPGVAHLFPEEGTDEALKGGLKSMVELISTLMETVKAQNIVITRISEEVAEMKKGNESGREIKKALEGIASIEERLAHLHETVPAAGEPRGIVKANPGEGGGKAPMTHQDLYALAAKGDMSAQEIAVLNLQLNRAE